MRTWQEAMLAAGAERGWDSLVAIASEALEAELPILRGDPDLLEVARSSSAANVALVAQLIRDPPGPGQLEPPPQAIAFARELARRNVPDAELSRAYRVAQLALWRWGVAEVRRRVDADAATDAVQGLTEAAFTTGDAFSTIVMERYAIERERWVRSAEAVRDATVQELLAGGRVDAAAAGRRLRYELAREHEAFVVWSDAESALPERAAAAVGGARALLVPLGAGVVAGWAPAGTLGASPAPEIAVAVGLPASGADGFRTSHLEAMEARRVARMAGPFSGTVRYDEIALPALLTKDPEQAAAFARRTLGPLAGGDATARRLATTLLTVLEEQGSPRHAARRLGVHENTVAKRLRAVDAALPPSARQGPAELMAALLVQRTLRGD